MMPVRLDVLRGSQYARAIYTAEYTPSNPSFYVVECSDLRYQFSEDVLLMQSRSKW